MHTYFIVHAYIVHAYIISHINNFVLSCISSHAHANVKHIYTHACMYVIQAFAHRIKNCNQILASLYMHIFMCIHTRTCVIWLVANLCTHSSNFAVCIAFAISGHRLCDTSLAMRMLWRWSRCYVRICVCMRMCVCVCCMYAFVSVYVCVYACIQCGISLAMRTCMYIRVCMCCCEYVAPVFCIYCVRTCVYICMCMCMYLCIHT
jgi:hypothetical protein